MVFRLTICLLLLGLLLALPFYFRREEAPEVFSGDADTVVVICAHNKTVRDEYERAFRKWYKERFGREIRIDFRTPGGTSDITRYIDDRFRAEFRRAFEKDPANGTWRPEYGDIFCDAKAADHPVRRWFLASEVGIGIDVFAGGGTFEHRRMAQRGYAVDGGVARRHPEYFGEGAIPASFGGDAIYDAGGRYYGVVLSTFGILCNADRLKELSDARPPERWSDLGEPRFFDTLVLADPSKSGSANKCYEIIVQQCMARAGSPEQGWRDGMNLLKRIFANARTVTDSASRVVAEVGSGDAAAGTAIDTYGFTEELWSAHRFGRSRVAYITPKGGTAVGADPVQILRGAPNRRAAEAFVDFLLSMEGQKLHAFRAGTPGGPAEHTLSRSPVRRELYAPPYRQYLFKPDYNPYASGADFEYRPAWTARHYTLLSRLIKSIMLDPRREMCRAWRAIIRAGGPEKVPMATAKFDELPFGYSGADAAGASLRISAENTPAEVAATLRRWSETARANYLAAEKLAEEGR